MALSCNGVVGRHPSIIIFGLQLANAQAIANSNPDLAARCHDGFVSILLAAARREKKAPVETAVSAACIWAP